MKRPTSTLWSVFLAGCILLCGCAAYQLGNATLFPADVRSVYVPIFESDSFRRNLGQRLTEAVVKEIEKRTPYKVVEETEADSILIGRMVAEDKRVVSEDRNDVPRTLELDLVVQIEWRSRSGDLLARPVPIPVEPVLVRIGQSAPLIPEAGQSLVTSQQRALEGLARQIVDQMERPW